MGLKKALRECIFMIENYSERGTERPTSEIYQRVPKVQFGTFYILAIMTLGFAELFNRDTI